MMNKLLLISIALFMVSSCHTPTFKDPENPPKNLCDQIEADSTITLNGTLNINSKDTLVFENVDKRNVWQRKIHLIPCHSSLRDYIIHCYDGYLYHKSFDEKFWVSVDGKFLTIDTVEFSPQFLFNSVAIIDEIDDIVDSSRVNM